MTGLVLEGVLGYKPQGMRKSDPGRYRWLQWGGIVDSGVWWQDFQAWEFLGRKNNLEVEVRNKEDSFPTSGTVIWGIWRRKHFILKCLQGRRWASFGDWETDIKAVLMVCSLCYCCVTNHPKLVAWNSNHFLFSLIVSVGQEFVKALVGSSPSDISCSCIHIGIGATVAGDWAARDWQVISFLHVVSASPRGPSVWDGSISLHPFVILPFRPSSSPVPRQLPIHFLPPLVSQHFLEFYKYGIFFIWLLLLSIVILSFIHFLVYISHSFLFIAVGSCCTNILQFVYPFTFSWTFGLLAVWGCYK